MAPMLGMRLCRQGCLRAGPDAILGHLGHVTVLVTLMIHEKGLAWSQPCLIICPGLRQVSESDGGGTVASSTRKLEPRIAMGAQGARAPGEGQVAV